MISAVVCSKLRFSLQKVFILQGSEEVYKVMFGSEIVKALKSPKD